MLACANSDDVTGLASWKSQMPEWTLEFWSDTRISSLLTDAAKDPEIAWFIPIFEKLPHMIQQIDCLRYLVLWMFGGVYLDMDVLIKQDLSPLLKGSEVVFLDVSASHTWNKNWASTYHPADKRSWGRGWPKATSGLGVHVGNWLMASAPKDRFWLHVLKHVAGRLDDVADQQMPWIAEICSTTGPWALGQALSTYRDPISYHKICLGTDPTDAIRKYFSTSMSGTWTKSKAPPLQFVTSSNGRGSTTVVELPADSSTVSLASAFVGQAPAVLVAILCAYMVIRYRQNHPSTREVSI